MATELQVFVLVRVSVNDPLVWASLTVRSGRFVPWTFCSLDDSFPGPFVP